ncbi:hypothetical protein M9Y10_035946 [Tritrichomonas musculus]|uniref:N-acetyltransferase domain-containing protein n=1 Tax=Tritrichomonas musculus TaxID=1915356 RepID=A0ABR2GVU8_9EUKA
MFSSIYKRNLSIRKGGPEDCDFIINLVGGLTQMVIEAEKMPIQIGIRETFQKMLKDPEHYPIFVAEEKDENGKVTKLGATVSSTDLMLYLGGPYLYLQEIIVNDKARGKKVGSALLEHIVQYAKDHGYVSVELTQPPDSCKYHKERTNFYTQHGFAVSGRSRSLELKKYYKIVD